ncbi:MAG TPA: alkaline phosphatase family protein [Terriglobales bacterium]|nr:alkaline phosphatase family protein [Terriglobales bacterium]
MSNKRLFPRLLTLFPLGVLVSFMIGCQGLAKAPAGGTTSGNSLQTSVNHIIFLAQENRSFDHYFGAMRQYWADYGYADQAFNGLPQFPSSSPSGPAPTNPGCDPAFAFPGSDCTIDAQGPTVTSYHLKTQCVENPSPSWNESHVDLSFSDPTRAPSGSNSASFLNGFVYTAAHDARTIQPPFNDVTGQRSMGYYDGSDLNYYYFMASNFATSDSWFSPVMTRTPPNRMYLIAGTSQGHAYELRANSTLLTAPIIFQRLQEKGITWKIYVHPGANGCSTATCLYQLSYIQNFTYGPTILSQFPQNIVPDSQFLTDAQNGTLPQVAMIEPPSEVGLDEHPADYDANPPCCSVQAGANYVSSLVGALMSGPSWKDSIFVLTFDEFGGFYDHVPPQPAVSPDGIKPNDLLPGDVCTSVTGPTCDFTFTGYRIPMIVISPFTKKHYVSHTTADNTAILRLIEKRFSIDPLSNRDAAQMDMTEFFEFGNPAWVTPPSPPAQTMSGPCYLDSLP